MTYVDKVLLLSVALGAACYSPTYPEGKPCAPDGSCPGDMVCSRQSVCWSPGLVDDYPIEPLPFPPDAYGQVCFNQLDCLDGMDCYVDFANMENVGYCTPICGSLDGSFDDDICRQVDPGFDMTFCSLSENPGDSPTYCVTFCDFEDLCPPNLVCADDPFSGDRTCQLR